MMALRWYLHRTVGFNLVANSGSRSCTPISRICCKRKLSKQCVPAGYRQAVPFADKAVPQYPDVKWGKGPDADVLYAAALDCAVDVYRLG